MRDKLLIGRRQFENYEFKQKSIPNFILFHFQNVFKVIVGLSINCCAHQAFLYFQYIISVFTAFTFDLLGQCDRLPYSNYFPWEAMYFVKRWYHCSNRSWLPFSRIYFSSVITVAWCQAYQQIFVLSRNFQVSDIAKTHNKADSPFLELVFKIGEPFS